MNPTSILIICPACGYNEEYTRLVETCPACGHGLLEAQYEFSQGLAWPEALAAGRPNSMWRYRELLPLRHEDNIVSLGEGMSELVRSENLAAMLGLRHLYIKDERQGPTGSFKDRQASLAISTLRELGVQEAVVASTGNVAIAYSAYAARARIKLWAFTISSIPPDKMREITLYGTELVKVTGTYDQAKQVAARFAQQKGLFYDKGLKNIASKESMKTLAFEIAEQLGAIYGPDAQGHPWRVPGWYIQSVSGGLGPLGVMKAFREMHEFGLTSGMPRLGLTQAEGCDPMARAFLAGMEEAEPIRSPKTRIATLATDVPGAAYGLLRGNLLEYGGTIDSVSDEEAYRALKTVARLEGLSVEPATAVAFAGLFKMVRQRLIDPDDIVVLNCSGHTFPVEKHILEEDLIHEMDVRVASRASIPQEGLLAALEMVDTRVNQVLVIEDDVNAAQLMGRILQAYGVGAVRYAPDGRAGIQMVHELRPDLIVLDLMMPHVDGFQVLDQLKRDDALRDVPVVVVTAKDLTLAERTRLSGQVKGLLQKGAFIDDEVLKALLLEKLG